MLEPPFHVLATANPIEYEGTYPLPEAQLDRFMMRTSFGYPTRRRRVGRVATGAWIVSREDQTLRQITDAATLIAMQEAVERVTVDESVGRYCVALATATRTHQHVLMGSSPRGSLGLLLAARAFAVIGGRDYVTPEDVKAVAEPVLAHRITVKPEMWMSQVSGRTVVEAVLSSVPTPAPLEPAADRHVTAIDRPAAARRATRGGRRRPTSARRVAAVVLIACALLWRRPDLLVIATPCRRGDGVVGAHPTERVTDVRATGSATRRSAKVTPPTWHGQVSGVAEIDLAVAALDDAPWVDTRPATRRRDGVRRSTASRASTSACDRHDGGRVRSNGCASSPPARGPRSDGRPSPEPSAHDPARSRRSSTSTPPLGPPTDSIGLHRSARWRRGQRVRRHPPVPSRRPPAADQLAAIGPRHRAARQLHVGRRRHPRRAGHRRHRRLRSQRRDRRARLEPRRRRAGGRSDRRALRAAWRAGVAAHVRADVDAHRATGDRTRPAPTDPRDVGPDAALRLRPGHGTGGAIAQCRRQTRSR